MEPVQWENMFPVDLGEVPLKAQENATVAFRRAGANPFEGKLEWRHLPPSYYAAKFGTLLYGDDGTSTLSDNPADILRPGEAILAPELKPADFWRGEFGNAYLRRNDTPELLESNRRFFEMALLSARYMHPRRVLEFGANIGMNLRALRKLGAFSMADFAAVEINRLAVEQLEMHGFQSWHADMCDPARPWGDGYDLTISKGVLIHIHPDKLYSAYAALHDASRELIFIAEYFSATRRQIDYRGHSDKLWLADYGSEFWDMYPDLECIDYGFAWKRDKVAPQDDLTYWLFRKS